MLGLAIQEGRLPLYYLCITGERKSERVIDLYNAHAFDFDAFFDILHNDNHMDFWLPRLPQWLLSFLYSGLFWVGNMLV